MRRTRRLLLGAVLGGAGAVAVACNQAAAPAAPVPGVVSVSGIAEDWRSGVPLSGAVVRTQLVFPQVSTVADQTGRFTLSGVPIDGYLILDVATAMSPAPHLETYSVSFLVGESDLTGIVAPAVSTQDATAFTSGFAVQSTSGRGVILGRVLSATGAPLPGIQQFQILPIGFAFSGPDYLDYTDKVPGIPLASTSAGGAFLFFNVTAGNVSVNAFHTGYSFQPSETLVAPGIWSLIDLDSTGAAGPTPTPAVCTSAANVKFGGQVIPIFQKAPPQGAGCATSNSCHMQVDAHPTPIAPASGLVLGGNGPGADKNGVYLHLTAPAVIPSPPFVNLASPADSQLLLRPTQVLVHPQQILKSPALGFCDPNYLTLYGWISQGAPNN